MRFKNTPPLFQMDLRKMELCNSKSNSMLSTKHEAEVSQSKQNQWYLRHDSYTREIEAYEVPQLL